MPALCDDAAVDVMPDTAGKPLPPAVAVETAALAPEPPAADEIPPLAVAVTAGVMITEAGIADDLARPPPLPPALDAGGGTGLGALLPPALDVTIEARDAAGPADERPATELTPPPELLKARVLLEGALDVVVPVTEEELQF